MKFRMALLGTAFCLASFAQNQKPAKPASQSNDKNKTTQTANRMKRAGDSIVGCVDQRGEKYVLRNAQTGELLSLSAPTADADDWFAKHVGHQVQANGSRSGEGLKVSGIQRVADRCDAGQ